ncbi:methionine vitamin-b12 independent [Neofusicoccum parvum]|uniref:Methionine vitamin-b12 independent n=2 Tax=Neofusicoccum parvum TaxID=310453 RepID=A0ACB5SBP5_9PEZI|nr:putative methionine vitamin-b12 protein [Neofusicoccum parvum UCRNP2]GME33820.1 methionine vitamin-b12 independent [Neofusicoccum parvum]GME57844.1 methionine vitamin-b12 independent [Neofusicoccum parvum]
MASTTLHRNPPFRAEHLGSLLRPKNLLDKRAEVHDGKAKAEELKPLEDEAIKDIVDKQQQWGYRALSDGEYRRHMFWGTFFPGLEGMKEVQNPSIDMFRTYVPDMAAFLETNHVPGETVICTGKIKHTGKSTYVDQVEYLKTLVPKERWGDIKLTLAAPNWYHLRYKEGQAYPKDVYSSDADYFADIAKAYQVELDILYKAGLRNVQYDDPNLAYFCSEKMLEGWKEDKRNTYTADELLDVYIKLYNDCIAKAPADMHIGIHLCRGNFVGSRHFAEGAYDRIATKLFRDLHMQTYYLEYDTPRAGGFAPLAHLPAHKNVVLGVVTSKFPALEDKEEMKRRIVEAADIVAAGAGQTREQALERLGVSPQCGFASHASGNLIDHEGMAKKLQLVRQIADEVWPGQP